jgi:hypothetical protein
MYSNMVQHSKGMLARGKQEGTTHLAALLQQPHALQHLHALDVHVLQLCTARRRV